MIPYDDLVIALQTWRAKQGLPVAQMSGQLTPPPIAAAPAAPAFAAPIAKSAPPGPPPRAAAPPPLDTTDDAIDEGLIEEASDENVDEDFEHKFAAAGLVDDPNEYDSIVPEPLPPDEEPGTAVASPAARRGGNGQNDW